MAKGAFSSKKIFARCAKIFTYLPVITLVSLPKSKSSTSQKWNGNSIEKLILGREKSILVWFHRNITKKSLI